MECLAGQGKCLVCGAGIYRLTLTYSFIARAEALAGCNMLAGLDNLHNLSALQFRGLLFCASHVAHPQLTVDDVGGLIGLDPPRRTPIIVAMLVRSGSIRLRAGPSGFESRLPRARKWKRKLQKALRGYLRRREAW
jgi:hypothetical protein